MPSRFQNLVNAFLLGGGRQRRGGLHQLGEAEDRVERAAELMTHAREEIRFRQIGSLGGRLGALELDVLVTQALIELLLLGFNLFPRGVIGADQQIADHGALGAAQRGHRNDRRKAAAVLANVGQFVDVLDPARGLENQRLEAWGNGGGQLGAQGRGARDDFLRVRNIGGGDLVNHVVGYITEHAFSAYIEDLNDASLVGRDAGEVGAVENRILQRAGFNQGLFGLFACGVIGADQQIADDRAVIVTQRRDRNDCRKAAAVLANVGQFVDVLDPARGLKNQRLEAWGNGGGQLGAQGRGARDDFLRVGNIGGGDLVDHVGGYITEHAFSAYIEDLNDASLVGRDAGEVGAVENRILQRAGFNQGLFGLFACGVIGADQQIADDRAVIVTQRRDRNDCRKAAAVLANVGQFVDVLDPARGLKNQRLEAWGNGGGQLGAQGRGARDDFLRVGNIGGGDLVDHVGGYITEHAFSAYIEDLND